MKKFMIAGVTFTLLLSACGIDKEDYNGANGNGTNPTIDATQRAGTPGKTKQDFIDDYGYTRIQSPVDDRRPLGNAPQIDRRQLSKIISRLVMQITEVKDAATLVTSDKVLIVYDAKTEDRNKTADMVKKSALSVVPRWYHVYVSDDTTLFEYLERYKNMDDNSEGVKHSVDALTKEMKKSPQGKRISDSEDENGVHKDEMKGNMK